MELERYYRLEEIADIFTGYPRTLLRCKSDKEKLLNIMQVKIVNWQEIKKITSGMNIDNTIELINFHRRYDKKIRYMQKGDIVFPIKSRNR